MEAPHPQAPAAAAAAAPEPVPVPVPVPAHAPATKNLTLVCRSLALATQGSPHTNICCGENGFSAPYLLFDPLDREIAPTGIKSAKLVFVAWTVAGLMKPGKVCAYEVLEQVKGDCIWKYKPLTRGTPTAEVEVFDSDAVYECDVTPIVKNWAETKNCFGIKLGVRELAQINICGMKSEEKRHPRIEVVLN